MIIFANETQKCYGTVGKETNIKDDLGTSLYVGDIVLVSHKSAKWQRLSFVCQYENKGEFYIPHIPHVRKQDAKDFTCEKILDCSKLKQGMKLGDFLLKKDDKT